MFIRFTTLSLIVAVVMASVSASRPNNAASVDVASNPSGAKLALPVMRTLSRRKVAALLERRRNACDHHNHRNYHRGDDLKYHHRPRRHRNCADESGSYCGDSDEYEEHDHYDFDEDDFYECDECDECDDDDFGYMSWEDYEDETT